tara:strand:+ start:484 stop:1110 length:627 start_codon:yes stop_codon:yes gene_type:complete
MIRIYHHTVVAEKRWLATLDDGMRTFFANVRSFREDEFLVAGASMSSSDAVQAMKVLSQGEEPKLAWLQRGESASVPNWLNSSTEDDDFLVWAKDDNKDSQVAMPAPFLTGSFARVELPRLASDLETLGVRMTIHWKAIEDSSKDVTITFSLGPHRCEALGVFRGRELVGLTTWPASTYEDFQVGEKLVELVKQGLADQGLQSRLALA